MTASIAMTNYFHSLRQREDFSFEIIMDNPRTFCSAPEVAKEQETSPKVSKAEKRWSQQLDLSLSSAAPGLAPFIPKRRLSMDVLDHDSNDNHDDSPPVSPTAVVLQRAPTPKTRQRKRKSKMTE